MPSPSTRNAQPKSRHQPKRLGVALIHGIVRTSFIGCLAVLTALNGCASTLKKDPAAPPPPSSATAGTTTIVAIAPPASSGRTTTLPELLGLPQLATGICGLAQHLGSRLANSLDLTGRFPALQPQPPLLALTDPANLQPDAPPAVQAAAEIKAEEDAAPQKIMALRYLATIGCGGCYEKVETALLQGMSDCTESVRYEAVKALECRPDNCCKFCSSSSCCSPAVRKRLEELTNCDHEQSPRVRRAARLALACCMGKPLDPEDVPREGPPAAPVLGAAAPAAPALESAQPRPVGSDVQTASTTNPLTNNPLTTNQAIASLVSDLQVLSQPDIRLTSTSNVSTSNAAASNPAASNPAAIDTATTTTLLTNTASQSPTGSPVVPSSVTATSTASESGKAVDRLLARVNGREIYASHVQQLLQAEPSAAPSVSIVERASAHSVHSKSELVSAVQRAIDWTLLHQQAQWEIHGHVDNSSLSPMEVQAWLERKLACEQFVSSTEILAWYQIHQDQYRLPSRVRWESMAVAIDQCADRTQAFAVANYLRRKALGENLPPPEFLSRAMVRAETHDWCELDKLPAGTDASLLASLPVGQLSQTVESDKWLMLVRVIERETARVQPLAAVAPEIGNHILADRGRAALNRYLVSLRAGSQIWIAPELLQSADMASSQTNVGTP